MSILGREQYLGAAKRILRHVAKLGSANPNIWRRVDELRAARSRGSATWPSWCLPLNAGSVQQSVERAANEAGRTLAKAVKRNRAGRRLRRHEKVRGCFRLTRSSCGKSDAELGLRSGSAATGSSGQLGSVARFVPTFAGRTGIRSGGAHGRSPAADLSGSNGFIPSLSGPKMQILYRSFVSSGQPAERMGVLMWDFPGKILTVKYRRQQTWGIFSGTPINVVKRTMRPGSIQHAKRSAKLRR